jgi:hypothetical protein
MDGYTKTVLGNGSVNKFPFLRSRVLIKQRLDYINGKMEELRPLCGPCRDVISKGQDQLIISSARQSVRRGLEPEAEE